jgi:hypothetical protein
MGKNAYIFIRLLTDYIAINNILTYRLTKEVRQGMTAEHDKRKDLCELYVQLSDKERIALLKSAERLSKAQAAIDRDKAALIETSKLEDKEEKKETN